MCVKLLEFIYLFAVKIEFTLNQNHDFKTNVLMF